MKVDIHTPHYLNEKGQRANNQDSIFPFPGSSDKNSRFFLVCDGVGGSSKGEVASKIVCETFGAHFGDNLHYEAPELDSALLTAESEINNYVAHHNEGSGMATTLTFLGFNEHGATFGHIGDSRVYHIRQKDILFRTRDHSLMNELIEEGIITPEEALSHPKRNIVTKAVMAGSHHGKIDFHRTEDIKAGDYFFLCSDGILESLPDSVLVDVLESGVSDQEKIDTIEKRCQEQSKDNFSAYLVRVKSVDHSVGNSRLPTNSVLAKPNLIKWGSIGLGVIVLACILSMAIGSSDSEETLASPSEGNDMESALEQLRSLDTTSIDLPSPTTSPVPEHQ